MFRERRVVDDRVFLLGLDHLYREAMQLHERSELLSCARVISAVLGVSPAEGPVEGYYSETPELTEYFRLMRGLQAAPDDRRPLVAGSWEFRRLEAVASSRLFGTPGGAGYLLPMGRDSLYKALAAGGGEEWTVERIVEKARAAAVADDDYSLVGLAALAGDPVVLAATRESIVLYAEVWCGCALRPEEPKYVWRVTSELARQAARFVGTFNDIFDENLPEPVARHAAEFWFAAEDNDVIGRCVRMALDDSTHPIRHYHWAIAPGPDGKGQVEEFWDTELWTTSRYRKKIGRI
jgi:hypothetical protein